MQTDQKNSKSLVIALSQLNPIVGDIAGNEKLAISAWEKAKEKNADFILFPELFLTGYPPEDLILHHEAEIFCNNALQEIVKVTQNGGPAIFIGTPFWKAGKLYNAVAIIDSGEIIGFSCKISLPNYDVFDEKRIFSAASDPKIFNVRGINIGIPICEDIWEPSFALKLVELGAQLLLVPNASPYERNKLGERFKIVSSRASETSVPIIYLNQIGGQDELVFDGTSFGMNDNGKIAFQMPSFKEELAFIKLNQINNKWQIEQEKKLKIENDDADKADYEACVLGLKDYVEKNKFSGVVLGLSGGIDSALVAAMAVDALGANRVWGIMLPYHYTSQISIKDAQDCAQRLGIRYYTLPIAPVIENMEAALAPIFEGKERDVTEENLQSRCRGSLLMAISNKFGLLLLTTGNKSEMATGYATLYGDMNGGFNPIKDIYKMEVFRLAELRNVWKPEWALGIEGEVIPKSILEKPPSAELRENQKDEDSLPPYPILDAILYSMIEEEIPLSEIISRGYDEGIVKRVAYLLKLSEHKRRQSAPGVKVSKRNFGKGRRYPITNGFK